MNTTDETARRQYLLQTREGYITDLRDIEGAPFTHDPREAACVYGPEAAAEAWKRARDILGMSVRPVRADREVARYKGRERRAARQRREEEDAATAHAWKLRHLKD